MLNRIIGSIFLIAGTSIGAGMLGLPIKLLGINIKISISIFLIIWLIILISSIAMLEISLWIKNDSNIITIAQIIYNKNISIFLSFIYLFFFFSLIIAYISSGLNIINNITNYNNLNKILFILPFCIINFYGIKIIDIFSKIFFLLLIISYLLLISQIPTLNKTSIKIIDFANYKMIFLSLPIIITSFGYNLLIPSIKLYLCNNKKLLLLSIIIGSLIPLIIYIFWEYLIYIFLTKIDNKILVQFFLNTNDPNEKLTLIIKDYNKYTFISLLLFSFSAIITSLIGVSLNIYDLIFDTIKINKKKNLKILVLISIFIIPLILNFFFSYIFMLALSYAGIFATILLIIFPIYTLWYTRYIKKIKYNYLIINNQFLLFFILFFGIFIIIIDILEKFFI